MKQPPLNFTGVCLIMFIFCYLIQYVCKKQKINVTSKMLEYISRDSPYRSDEQHCDDYSLDIANTLRSLKAQNISFKEDNDRIIQSQERLARSEENKVEVNAVVLQSLHICRDKDRLRLVMDRRKGPMGHMEIGLNQDTCLKGMTQLEMVGSWIHLT